MANQVPLLVSLTLCQGWLSSAFLADWTEGLFASPTSHWHTTITQNALKRVTSQLFNSSNFKADMDDMQLTTLIHGKPSLAAFYEMFQARQQIANANAHVDKAKETKDHPYYHFDAEKFDQANGVILGKWAQLIAALKNESYKEAREYLGQAMHTIQDFYSHSNWIEMGNNQPNADIGVPGGSPFPNVAAPDQPTCSDCKMGLLGSNECHDNILPEINQQKILTSGYYRGEFISENDPVPKPTGKNGKGKCSHGNVLDTTRFETPTGGISKDANNSLWAPHSYLHFKAAQIAEDASVLFIQNIQRSVPHEVFSQLLGVSTTSTIAIVVDTSSERFLTHAREQAALLVQEATKLTHTTRFGLISFNESAVVQHLMSADAQMTLKVIGELKSKRLERSNCASKAMKALKQTLSLPYLTHVFLYTDGMASASAFLSNLGCPLHAIAVVGLTDQNCEVSEDKMKEQVTAQCMDRIITSGKKLTAPFLQHVLSGNGATVLSTRVSNGQRSVEGFVVDSAIPSFAVIVRGGSQNVDGLILMSPSGTSVACEPIFESDGMLVCLIPNPVSGIWHISGLMAGQLLTVTCESTLDVICQLFTEDPSRSQPYPVPLTSNPTVNSTVIFQCYPSQANVALTSLLIFRTEGEDNYVDNFPLRHQGARVGFYVAKLQAPSHEFSYGVNGFDINGHPFHRKAFKIINPQP